MQTSTRNILVRAAMSLFFVLFCISSVWAEDVTTEQAFEEALTFLANRETSSGGPRRAPGVAPQLKLQGKVSGLYVFNIEDNGGFVIVSNDDRTVPILGFSDKGSLDPDNMPDNMRAWLQGYADEIAWLAEHGQAITGPKKARQKVGSHSTNAIAPLITTTWNQGKPYNDLCPMYDDPDKGSVSCVTGCVATAMAQVMKYHEWPTDATQPIPGYTSSSYNMNLESLPAITFDWTNMKDDYSGSYTTAEATAVATLMQYCGYSVEMDYGPSSGSFTSMVANALKEYFDYNSTAEYIVRSMYSTANWTDIIYHELANRRPVIYAGSSSGGGHAFVCDGYKLEDDTDYFHINWGWGGKSNDYFVLSSLNPYEQGIGGSSSKDGFHYGQQAVIGIQKPSENGTIADIPASNVNLIINSMTVCSPFAVVGQPIRVIVNVTNDSTDDYSGDIWIGTKKEDNSYALLSGNNADIPAGETKDCVIEYTPNETGTLNFVRYLPTGTGFYNTDRVVRATVNVLENTSNNVVPVYGFYCDEYTKSQFIIPEANMQNMQDMFITGMTFYAKEENISWGDAEFDVYLSEVSETILSEISGWMDWSTLEKVYAGSLSISSGKMKITFDTPFKYQGGNLLVGTNQTKKGDWNKCNWYGITADEGASMGGWGTGIFPQEFLPHVAFDLSATAYPEPFGLAVNNITSTSAEVCWLTPNNPPATSFELQYAEGNAFGSLLRYDNGTCATNLGSDTSGTWTWGVMYPGNLVNATRLEKVIIYENDSNTEDITINIYQGGDDAPGTLLYTETVTPVGGFAFHKVTLATPVAITPGENLWITLTETGTFVIAACASTEPNNQWFFDGDTWVNIGDLVPSLAGNGWMIRAEINDDINPETASWTTIAGATSPTELTGLTPETTYSVRVKSIYGTEGESLWTATVFTTTSANPVPFNLAADLRADGATITWDGEGESYNVRYKTAGFTELFFFDDFENGMNQWTIYTEGEASGTDGWFATNPTNGLNFESHSGNYCASAWSWNGSTYDADNWLVTPQVTFGKELRFWVRTNAGYPESYEVLLSTKGNATTDFTIELQALAPAPATRAWEEVVIDLSAYRGQEGYIAIHHVDNDKNYLLIDDFGIYGISAPTGTWQEMAVSGTAATISSLDTNNAYEYQVQSVKGGDISEWSETGKFALLTLANNADNTSLINAFNGMQAHVSLTDRTIYKDNTWNTICLPFDLFPAELAASPLADTDIRAFSSITVDGTTTTLNFTNNIANTKGLLGGCPLLIKWDDNTTISDPQFANVTITSDTWPSKYNDAGSGITVTFKGTYAPMTFTSEDKSILFVGADNKLFWPLAGAKIGAMRSYLEIEGASAGVKPFVMDFGEVEDPDGICLTTALSDGEGDWYDLSGRKLAGKPTRSGIYIKDKKKVTVK